MKCARDWGRYADASSVTEAVCDWAYGVGWVGLEEVGSIVPGADGKEGKGRLDILLVPVSTKADVFGSRSGYWTDRLGIAGVEVKVSKSDFTNGLESGQFDRYAGSLCGLYLAGPPEIVPAREVPRRFGVLHVSAVRRDAGNHRNYRSVVCRRHPEWNEHSSETSDLWRVIFGLQEEHRNRLRALREHYEVQERRIRDIAGTAISKAIRSVMEEN